MNCTCYKSINSNLLIMLQKLGWDCDMLRSYHCKHKWTVVVVFADDFTTWIKSHAFESRETYVVCLNVNRWVTESKIKICFWYFKWDRRHRFLWTDFITNNYKNTFFLFLWKEYDLYEMYPECNIVYSILSIFVYHKFLSLKICLYPHFCLHCIITDC